MSRRRRILAVVALVAALCAGGWAMLQKRAHESGEIILYGNVDIREVNLGFRVAGKVSEVLKDEGDEAGSGDVLARLDDDPYRHEVAVAAAEAASLQARFDMLQSGYRREEVEQARASVLERQAIVENARRLFARQSDLVKQRAISQQDYDDAKEKLDEAQARLKAAQHSLSQLEAGYRPEEVAQASADLSKAKASLEMARIRLADTEIRAPADGVIITRALEPGAIVQPGTTVLTLSLEKPVWVRAYITEPQLGLIRPGMAAEVYTDSHPGKPLTGKIGFISPRAEFTPKTVETQELRTSLAYRIRVVVTDPDAGLRQGMPVTVKIGNP